MNSITVITNMGQDAGIAANMIQYLSKEPIKTIHRTGNYRNPLSAPELNKPFISGKVISIGDILKPDHIAILRSNDCDLMVIDRHERFINSYKAQDGDILDTKCSLAELTFRYLYPGKEVPKAFKLISDYETWTFDLDETLPFHYGLGMESVYDEDFINKLVNGEHQLVDNLVRKGQVIHDYVEAQEKQIGIDTFRLGSICGQDCITANIRGINSLFFKHAKTDKRFEDIKLYLTYGWYPKQQKYRCSLYSEDPNIDAGSIATILNGGGSPEVAGFNIGNVSEFLVDLKDKVEDDYSFSYGDQVAVDKLASNPIVKTYTQQHERIIVNSMKYYIRISGRMAVMCNIPYTHPDLWFNARVSNVDIGVTYAMTSSGRYRIVITDFSGQDMEAFAKEIGGKNMPNGTIWKYTDGEDWFNK